MVSLLLSANFAPNQWELYDELEDKIQDDLSGGELRTIYYYGAKTQEDVINFFGLDTLTFSIRTQSR